MVIRINPTLKGGNFTMKISWHGQACLQIETEKSRLIIDPYITDNPLSDLTVSDLQVDYILLTHAHNDHIGDTEAIARQNDATIIANFEIATYFANKGLKTHGMQPGGAYNFDFGKLFMTSAVHGSTYEESDGSLITLGLAAGFVLEAEGKAIYHAGDTGLFYDMKLIGHSHQLDYAFLPIGDNFTMGPKEAAKAARWIQANQVVPIHFNTSPLINQNPEDFIQALDDPRQGVILPIGKVLDLI